ncbi:exported hypothetical protein [Verrucomicrobia bacterium]|nr:exported hypothetical protein [Verrucomicrobiota bacterium]
MRTIKLAIIAILLAGVVQTKAQTNTPSAKTNWVQTLNFQFAVWEDGKAKFFTITSKDIVTALSGVSTSITNGTNIIAITLPAFDNKATLVRRQIIGDTNEGNVRYFVREPAGRTNTDYNVSPFFTHTNIATTTFNSGKGITEHNVEGWSFNAPTLSFDVQGFVTRKRGIPTLGSSAGVVLFGLTSQLAGTGVVSAVSSDQAVFEGSLTVTGGKAQ